MPADAPKDDPAPDPKGPDTSEVDISVEIKGLMLDPSSNLPIVILRDPETDRFVPIWIGIFEAQAIALRMEGVEPPRPMTHDLLNSSLAALGARVDKIVITDLRDKTFFAEIYLRLEDGEQIVVDSRPSDALALALRAEAEVFVRQKVMARAQAGTVEGAPDQEQLRKMLEELDPEDLGEYEM